LRFPNDNVALVDAGNKGFAFDAGQRYVDPVLKYYGISKIDYLIASHPHGDHIGGFEFILSNYRVDTLVINAFPMQSKLYQRILKLAKQKKVFIKVVDRGDIIYADSRTRLYILHPAQQFLHHNNMSGEVVNNTSLVIKIVHGKNSILLNGDAEFAAERSLVKYTSFLDCDILKVAHHGSKTSSSDLFLDWAKPGWAVISVGKKNKFNHPSPGTLLKYAGRKIPVLRTDISGAVVFESDGKNLKRVNWR
jgi:competence protein ComEC